MFDFAQFLISAYKQKAVYFTQNQRSYFINLLFQSLQMNFQRYLPSQNIHYQTGFPQIHGCASPINSLELMQIAVKQQQKMLSSLNSITNKKAQMENGEGLASVTMMEIKNCMKVDEQSYIFDSQMQEQKFDFFNDQDSESPFSPNSSYERQMCWGANLNQFTEILNPTEYQSYFAC